ncbi:MAG: helix-turn-helix transcriptional regulator [Ruminococcus sp.]|nr:helix-turn-helix transcriptional regulator [Ruminococcus sp.]
MATVDEFAKRLTDLREKRGLKRQEVADDEKVKISRASLEYYEKGKRKPDIEILAKLADFYGVSTDYLLGLSDVPTTDKDLQFVCDYTELHCDVLDNLTHNPTCVNILNYLLADENILNFAILCVQIEAYKRKNINLVEFIDNAIKNDINTPSKSNYTFEKYHTLVDSCDLTEYQIKKQFDIIVNSLCKDEKEKANKLTAKFVNTDFYRILQMGDKNGNNTEA